MAAFTVGWGEGEEILLSAHTLPFIIGMRIHTDWVVGWVHAGSPIITGNC
jgi:hypothetical protein